MNRDLRQALLAVGWEGASDPWMWRRVVLVLNYGRVPPPPGGSGYGFKLLLLDRTGRPEWFARCGWADRFSMKREADLLAVLRADPFGATHVPESRVLAGDPLFVQVSRYLGDVTYASFIASRTASAWSQDAREIVTVAARLMSIARRDSEPLRDAPSQDRRASWLDADFTTLANAGLPSTLLQRLRLLSEPSLALPAELQHGDLWPANVLRADDRWWLIDFAECGIVWSPLYDLLHLLSTAPPAAGALWYALPEGTNRDPWLIERHRLLREASVARGLTEEQLAACLLFYLVHLTAYRLRPMTEFSLSENLRAELVRVGAELERNDWNAIALVRGILS